jgi:hypothetical protein
VGATNRNVIASCVFPEGTVSVLDLEFGIANLVSKKSVNSFYRNF